MCSFVIVIVVVLGVMFAVDVAVGLVVLGSAGGAGGGCGVVVVGGGAGAGRVLFVVALRTASRQLRTGDRDMTLPRGCCPDHTSHS